MLLIKSFAQPRLQNQPPKRDFTKFRESSRILFQPSSLYQKPLNISEYLLTF